GIEHVDRVAQELDHAASRRVRLVDDPATAYPALSHVARSSASARTTTMRLPGRSAAPGTARRPTMPAAGTPSDEPGGGGARGGAPAGLVAQRSSCSRPRGKKDALRGAVPGGQSALDQTDRWAATFRSAHRRMMLFSAMIR